MCFPATTLVSRPAKLASSHRHRSCGPSELHGVHYSPTEVRKGCKSAYRPAVHLAIQTRFSTPISPTLFADWYMCTLKPLTKGPKCAGRCSPPFGIPDVSKRFVSGYTSADSAAMTCYPVSRCRLMSSRDEGFHFDRDRLRHRRATKSGGRLIALRRHVTTCNVPSRQWEYALTLPHRRALEILDK